MAEMSPADIGAVMGGRNSNGYGFGADAGMFYLLILFLFGMGGWGGYGNNGNLAAEMQNGFNNQAVQSALGNMATTLNNGFADTRFAIAQENCQDRQVFNDGFRDLIAAGNANTQLIVGAINQNSQNLMEKLCQLELDALKTKNNEQASMIASLKAQIATMENNAYLLSQIKGTGTTTAG